MAGYKRRIYLINPSFQIRFSLYVCFLLFLSSLIYPLTIYDLMNNFMEHMYTTSPEDVAELSQKRTSLIIILALWQLGFIALAFIISIFLTHKVAGPLYKLQQFFSAIGQGSDNGTLKFRGGDYFHEVADSYNEAIGKMKEDYKQDLVYLSEVNSYINNLSMVVPEDKKAVIQEISKRLTHIQEKFNRH